MYDAKDGEAEGMIEDLKAMVGGVGKDSIILVSQSLDGELRAPSKKRSSYRSCFSVSGTLFKTNDLRNLTGKPAILLCVAIVPRDRIDEKKLKALKREKVN